MKCKKQIILFLITALLAAILLSCSAERGDGKTKSNHITAKLHVAIQKDVSVDDVINGIELIEPPGENLSGNDLAEIYVMLAQINEWGKIAKQTNDAKIYKSTDIYKILDKRFGDKIEWIAMARNKEWVYIGDLLSYIKMQSTK